MKRCAYFACLAPLYRGSCGRKFCNTRCKDRQRKYVEKCRRAGVVPA